MILDPRLPSSPDNDWPAWSKSGREQELPADLSDIDLDVWRICGLDRTVDEEMADTFRRAWELLKHKAA